MEPKDRIIYAPEFCSFSQLQVALSAIGDQIGIVMISPELLFYSALTSVPVFQTILNYTGAKILFDLNYGGSPETMEEIIQLIDIASVERIFGFTQDFDNGGKTPYNKLQKRVRMTGRGESAVICSPQDIKVIRERHLNMIIIADFRTEGCPDSPCTAIENGANYLIPKPEVIGILVKEIEKGLEAKSGRLA